jgi:hypothetical protein
MLGKDYQEPDDRRVDERQHYRRAADVLGALRQAVVLERDAVDGGFDRGVEQLDDQHQDQAGDQQGALDPGVAEPEGDRRQQRDQDQLLAEGILVAGRGGEAGKRVARRVDDALQAGLALEGAFGLRLLLYVGIPSVNSSSS